MRRCAQQHSEQVERWWNKDEPNARNVEPLGLSRQYGTSIGCQMGGTNGCRRVRDSRWYKTGGCGRAGNVSTNLGLACFAARAQVLWSPSAAIPGQGPAGRGVPRRRKQIFGQHMRGTNSALHRL